MPGTTLSVGKTESSKSRSCLNPSLVGKDNGIVSKYLERAKRQEEHPKRKLGNQQGLPKEVLAELNFGNKDESTKAGSEGVGKEGHFSRRETVCLSKLN